MKKMTVLAAGLLFLSPICAATDLDQAAADVCKCLEAPYAQVEQALGMISAAQASGDTSALIAAQGEMMGVVGASGQCFEALASKYPEVDQSPELQQQVMAMADEQCPNPAAGMAPN